MRVYRIALLLVVLVAAGCSRSASEGERIVVATHNIGNVEAAKASPAQIVDLYSRFGWPDVLIMQESGSRSAIEQLVVEFEAAGAPRYNWAQARTGVAILSRHPIETVEEIRMGSSHGALVTGARLPSGRVDIIGVHFQPTEKSRDEAGVVDRRNLMGDFIRELFRRTVRTQMAEQLLDWLDDRGESAPVIIAGDFNTAPFTTAIRVINARYRDALLGTGDFLTGTYWKVGGRLKPRVDFIFHSSELIRLGATVIKERTGDHYPVMAELALPTPTR